MTAGHGWTTLVLVLAVAALAACAGPEGGPEDGATVGPEGATIAGPQGSSVHVPAGVVSEGEIRVIVESETQPSDDVPGEILSPVFSVRAKGDGVVDPSASDVVEVRLPMSLATAADPGGASSIALAVRAPAGSWTSRSDTFWHTTPGFLSDDGASLVLEVFELPTDPIQIVLVHDAAVASDRGTLDDVGAAGGVVSSSLYWLGSVVARVPIGSWSDFADAEERRFVEGSVAAFGEEAVAAFQELGFRPPRLNTRKLAGIPSDYLLTVYPASHSECAGGTNGSYNAIYGSIYVCWRIGGDFGEADALNATQTTTRHELFHAVQNAYTRLAFRVGTVHPNQTFVDATATLAERSIDGVVRRTPENRLPLEVRQHDLESLVGRRYMAQDLFAFLLRGSDAGFGRVAELMTERQLSWATIDRVLQDAPDGWGFDSVEAFYWSFVRNQHYERTVDLGDAGQPYLGIFGNEERFYFDDKASCSPPSTSLLDAALEVTTRDDGDSLAFALVGETYEATLAPMSTSIRRIEIDPAARDAIASSPADVTIRVRAKRDGIDGSGPVKSKLYPALQTDCSSQQYEGVDVTDAVPLLLEGPAYLLLANAGMDASVDVTVALAAGDDVPDGPATREGILFASGDLSANDGDLYTVTPGGGSPAQLYDADGRVTRARWNDAGDELVLTDRPVSRDGDHRRVAFSGDGAVESDDQLLYVPTASATYSGSVVYDWHPSEDSFLYKKADTSCGGNSVWRRYFDGREDVYLDPAILGDGIVYTIDFHPNGDEVIWASQIGCWSPTLAIWHADLVAGEIDTDSIELLYDSDRYVAWARWSPDGTRIAFRQSDAGRGYEGPENLYVMNADGTSVTPLTDYTSSSERLTTLTWSPDGSQIAFTAGSPIENLDVYVVDADGGPVTRVATTPGMDAVFDWR